MEDCKAIKRRGNNRQCLRYMQSRTWLLSWIGHFADSSPAERLRMIEVIGEVNDLSGDEESPQHGLGEHERYHALIEAHKAFKSIMNLLEHDRFEEVTMLVNQLGGALRDVRPPSSNESMEEETLSQRARRYGQCGQSEASDPDFWATVN